MTRPTFPFENSLAVTALESHTALKELLDRQSRGELIVVPKHDSLYVWRLTVTRYRPDYTYSDLFLTAILAEEAACFRILQFYGDGVWSQEYREVLLRRMKAGEFRTAMTDWQQSHSSMSFKVERQEVQATACFHGSPVGVPK